MKGTWNKLNPMRILKASDGFTVVTAQKQTSGCEFTFELIFQQGVCQSFGAVHVIDIEWRQLIFRKGLTKGFQ